MKIIIIGALATLSITTSTQADTYNLSYNGESISFTQTDETEYEYTDDCWIDCGDKFNYNNVLYETKAEAETEFNSILTIIEAHTTPKPELTLTTDDLLKTFPSDVGWEKNIDEFAAFLGQIVNVDTWGAVLTASQWNAEFKGNGQLRFDQGNIETGVNHEVYINKILYVAPTYDLFYKVVDAKLKGNIDGFQFQINENLPENNMRIKLKVGAYEHTGFGAVDNGATSTDWIYGSDTSDIIVNLATNAFSEGFQYGFESGFREGYEKGYTDGYMDGFRVGYEVGVNK